MPAITPAPIITEASKKTAPATVTSLDAARSAVLKPFGESFPMQDKFEQQAMRVVMKTEFSPKTRENIVWDNFVSDDIPAMQMLTGTIHSSTK